MRRIGGKAAVLLAVVLGLAAAYLVFSFLNHAQQQAQAAAKPVPTVAVLTAAQNIPSRTAITPAMVRLLQVPATVKLKPGAQTVARRFIETAVARKNLPEAYNLVTQQLKQGQSLKSWNTGNIAVIPYPVDDIKYAPMKIDFSYTNEAQIEVALLPKAGAKIKAQLFLMDLVKRNGKWLVNSWVPKSLSPVAFCAASSRLCGSR